MEMAVKLDADVEELLRNEARNRNVDFNQVLNEAIRAGLAPRSERFVQKTYAMGCGLDLTHALALADELEDEERLRKMKLLEEQELARRARDGV
jgi:hypothetical protein